MGLIAQRMAAASELRYASDFLTNDEWEPSGGSRMTSAGVSVSSSEALSVSTFWRCIDILSSTAAFAPKDVVVKVGGRSFPEYTTPSWMTTPHPANPTYTVEDYFSEVAVSLLIDGNYFTWASPSVFEPYDLTVLDPSRCVPKYDGRLDILDSNGHVERTLGPMEYLHGKLFKQPGSLRGISPLEKFRRSIGGAIAADDFAARFFGQGASLSFGVEVPYAMDPLKLNNLRDSLRQKYAGVRNSHAIGVLSEGGKFVTGLAPTPDQAQMLETRKFAVEDLGRIYGIPPGMLGSQEPGASSFASAESWKDNYKEVTLMPLVGRIETQHSRLLSVPAGITDPSASVQFKVNLDAYLRTDALKRMQTYREGIQAGVYTPDYARGKEDLPPLPGGDQLYMQAQMTPLATLAKQTVPAGTAPTTPEPAPVRVAAGDPIAEARASMDSSVEILATVQSARAMADSGAQMLAGLNALGRQISAIPAPVVNVPAPVVNVEAPVVNVPAPIVNVPAPIVNVPAPIVNVAAPVVDITPVAKVVAGLAKQASVKTVRRDNAGRIVSVIEEPTR